jgi:hypothetical protein
MILFPFFVAAETNYTHKAVSDWLYKPKIWTNSTAQVLWADGANYNSLTLYNGHAETLTNNCKNGTADFNDHGQATWIETDGQVYLFDGNTTTKLTAGPVTAWNLNLNKNGHVVWDANDETGFRNIYLFDGRHTTRLSTSGVNGQPLLSDKGDVAWIHADWNGINLSDFEVQYFDGHRTQQLTFNQVDDDFLRIASSGQLVWLSFTDNGTEVFYYDGHIISQLTDNLFDETWPVISPKGQPFWTSYDGQSQHSELFTLVDGAVWQVTDNQFEDGYPQVNKSGQFAWMGWAGTDWPWEVFYFNGSNLERLTENSTFDVNPLVSKNGFVVWTHNAGPYTQAGELHLYDGKSIQRITPVNPANLSDIPKGITVRGEVVYVERNRNTDEERIFIALPEK